LSHTYFWHLILGTIPVVILGAFAHDFVVEFDSKRVMGISSMFFGVLLFAADKISISRNKRPVSLTKSFIIGCFQAISVLPGVSRMGITITAARMLSIDRRKSISFAMFLAIPSICGSLVLELLTISKGAPKHDLAIFSRETLYGMLVTAIISILAIYPCVRLMEKYGFLWIAAYRVIIGCVIAFL
jgi:undecaprenyl-diphosphatase